MTIDNIEKAEDFVKNLKRSDNWVSNEELLTKLNDSYKIILENGREDLIPFVTVNIALYYIDLGEYGQAWEQTEVARKYAEKTENLSCILDAISLQYRIQKNLGNLDNAQQLINEQIKISYNSNNILQIASSYYNQGLLYHRQKIKSNAIESFIKSIEYILKTKQEYYIANFHIGYAGILLDFKEFRRAIEPLNIGFKIAETNQFLTPLAMAYSNYGLLFAYQENEIKCIESYKKSIEIFKKLNYTNDMVSVKIMLSDAYISFNKFKIAEKLLKQTLQFSKRNKLKYNLIGIYESLSSLYEKSKKYNDALQYYKKIVKSKEEFLNIETDKRLKNLEVTQKIDILKIEKENAERMSLIKHDFLANMSHEIRTPINSILGICYLLQQQSLNTIQDNYVNRLKRSGENLLGIINDVLDISKIESGKMELVVQPFSLNTLIQDVYNTIEPKSLEKKLEFIVVMKNKTDIQVNGDFVRLQQVLINLVSNAIKFTEKGNVTLQVKAKETDKQNIEIEFIITDTGIGIPKDKIDKIFERYEQASATIKNTFGGTGLGLSISKKIIELMNGNIQLKSKLNKGTQFIVKIPFKTKKHQTIEKQRTEINYQILKNKTIIIADDNEENRLVAKEILLSANKSIAIYEAENGQQVLSILEKNKADILFIDMDMPVLNGIETVEKVRNNKKLSHLKIIGNTASLSTFSNEDLISLGFDDFIYKPYKVENLIYIIQEVLIKKVSKNTNLL